VSPRIEIYDVTLRDGAQGPGIKFSAEDQLRIACALDAFGVSYIEGGQPGSNPKAAELFARTKDLGLSRAKMVAFGSTRHPKSSVETDANIKALLAADTETITIFAKSSPPHVEHVLRVSLDENLRLVHESVAYLRAQNRRVFFDAEHFFDGYALDAGYALAVLDSACDAGAELLVLCETNGGRLPHEVSAITRAVHERFPEAPLGIHTHNDGGCAVANALAAVLEGAVHVQGTINGYGERTGNANLCTVVPDLQLKMGYDVVSPEQLSQLTHLSHLVAELANMAPRDFDPFVGRDAFTHKGGMHADAVHKFKPSYEHADPDTVGNRTRVPVSEVSGRSSLLQKAGELGMRLDRDNPLTRRILNQIKQLEKEGFEFEGADASLKLLLHKARGEYQSFFKVRGFHVSVSKHPDDRHPLSEATVRIDLPDGTRLHTAAEGHGPVDALNAALRKAIEDIYPEIREVRLEDYKVRILNARAGTRARTRVLIEFSDTEETWNTVGVSENVIFASYVALIDSIVYKLLRSRGPAPSVQADDD